MNGMIANQIKTKCLPLAGKPVVYLNSPQPLENVQLHKDLGIFIASDLKWPNHVEIQLAKFNSTLLLILTFVCMIVISDVKLLAYSPAIISQWLIRNHSSPGRLKWQIF